MTDHYAGNDPERGCGLMLALAGALATVAIVLVLLWCLYVTVWAVSPPPVP